MAKFGKILVFVNLMFSLMLMIWAMNGYVHRIDWTDNPAKPKEGGGMTPEGELVKRSKNVKAAWLPMPESERDWRLARNNLETLEKQRRVTRQWYEAQLALLEKDPNPKEPKGLSKIDLVNGRPVLAPPPNPDDNVLRLKMIPAEERTVTRKIMNLPHPLTARNVYDDEEKELFDGDEAKMKDGLLPARTRHRKEVENNVETITRMLGPKGLHTRLMEERAKREALVAEYEQVMPLQVNTAASSEFAVQREKELQARVAELEERRNEVRRKLGVAGD